MQKAPVMKGSGLKPLEESKTDDEVVHVFGKNLEERVVSKDEGKSPPISFDNVTNQQSKDEDDIESIKRRKFDARTGEENEETVFQGDFKLFVWDLPTSNWIEKGRGQLKLNDPIDDSNTDVSRLIMRISGTLRIILNVAIRHSTFRIINNSKTSIRFTDSQTVWAASGTNAHQLKELIDERLKLAEEVAREDKKRSRPDEDSSTPPKKTKVDAKNSPSEKEQVQTQAELVTSAKDDSSSDSNALEEHVTLDKEDLDESAANDESTVSTKVEPPDSDKDEHDLSEGRTDSTVSDEDTKKDGDSDETSEASTKQKPAKEE